MKHEIDSFTIGGTPAGPSMPGKRLQGMIGGRIAVDMYSKSLIVPTPKGNRAAYRGDRVILYDDDTLEVDRHGA